MNDQRNTLDFEKPVSLVGSIAASIRLAVADYTLGLDLSHHRPNLDLRSAKQQGIRFIITKATQGDYMFNKDDWYVKYRDQSKSKGLPFGAFHYWDAAVNPLEQAKYFYDHVGDDLELLPIWDIEKYGNQGQLPPVVAAQQIHDGLQETAQLFGRDVMVYTNRDSWQVLTANSPIIAAYPLWVANWTAAANPTLPIGATEWVFWQYTNQYQVEGYPRGLDANRFNGNEAAFEEYVRSLKVEPPPENHDHPDLNAEIENLNAIADKHDKDISAIIDQLHAQGEWIAVLEQKMKDIGTIAIR